MRKKTINVYGDTAIVELLAAASQQATSSLGTYEATIAPSQRDKECGRVRRLDFRDAGRTRE